MKIWSHLSRVLSVTSAFSKCIISSKDVMYKLLTIPTLGILNKCSGSRWISFIMFANLTGSSFLKNMKDLRSHALKPGTRKLQQKNREYLMRLLYYYYYFIIETRRNVYNTFGTLLEVIRYRQVFHQLVRIQIGRSRNLERRKQRTR